MVDMSPLNHQGQAAIHAVWKPRHPWWTLTAPSSAPRGSPAARCQAPKQVVGDIPAEYDRQRSAQGGPGRPLPTATHPELHLHRSVLLPILETRGRRAGLSTVSTPSTAPPCPAGLGAHCGGVGFHTGSEHTRQPRGLQGEASRCC